MYVDADGSYFGQQSLGLQCNVSSAGPYQYYRSCNSLGSAISALYNLNRVQGNADSAAVILAPGQYKDCSAKSIQLSNNAVYNMHGKRIQPY
jgi:hypothetical protein